MTDELSSIVGRMLDTFGLPLYSKYSALERSSSTGPLKTIFTLRRFPSYVLLARGDHATTDDRVLCNGIYQE